MKKVLIVADEFCSPASGARVSQHVVGLLLDRGVEVIVVTPILRDEQLEYKGHKNLDVRHLPHDWKKSLMHVISPHSLNEFTKVLRETKPDIVHFCSFGYHHSRYYIHAAKEFGCRIVTQEFSYSSYCGRQKDCMDSSGPCGKCIGGHNLNALRYGCGPWRTRPIQILSRYLLWKNTLPQIDAVMVTCSYMERAMRASGVPDSNIIRATLPFPSEDLCIDNASEGNYWLFSGQFRHEKGSHFLEELIKQKNELNLYALLLVSDQVESEYQQFLRRTDSYLNDQIKLDTSSRWNSGGKEIAENCLAVFLPSVWPSSTEYTLLEALGLGKPLVAFSVGVNEDVLVHRENAMVYKVGDFQGMLEGMDEIEKNEQLRKKLRRGAFELFQEMTDDGKLVDSLFRAYDI